MKKSQWEIFSGNNCGYESLKLNNRTLNWYSSRHYCNTGMKLQPLQIELKVSTLSFLFQIQLRESSTLTMAMELKCVQYLIDYLP
jgi:hypothetical protein